MKERIKHLIADHMAKAPETIPQSIELLLVSRNLERIADHATNMAEDAIFLVEARDVRHKHHLGDHPADPAREQ